MTGLVYRQSFACYYYSAQKRSTALWQLVFQSYWLLVFLTRQTLTEGREKAKKPDCYKYKYSDMGKINGQPTESIMNII